MDATHIHLMANHVPLQTTIFSLLILGWGIFKHNVNFQNLAMVGFVIAGVFSIIALQSGEGAEDIVENLPGVAESFIHNHEEAAETTNWIAITVALMSLAGFGVRRMKATFMEKYLWILWVGSVVSAGMFSYTAYLGGQIRHTEIRPDASVQQTDAANAHNSEETENGE